MKDARGRVGPQAERARCPRAALRPAPGRPGHQPAGTMTGARGASLEMGTALAGGKPAAFGVSAHEAWPVAAPWGWNTLPGRNRGGTPTGERARQRTGRRKPTLIRGAPPCPLARHQRPCVCRRSASFFLFHLSPPRGERSSAARVRGRCRESELCGWCDSVAKRSAALGQAATPPHPTLCPHAGRGSEWPCQFYIYYAGTFWFCRALRRAFLSGDRMVSSLNSLRAFSPRMLRLACWLRNGRS